MAQKEQLLELALQQQSQLKDLFEKANYQSVIDIGIQALVTFGELEKWNNCIDVRLTMIRAYGALAQIETAKKVLEETLQLGLKHLEKEDKKLGEVYYQFGYLHAQILHAPLIALLYFQKSLKIFNKEHGLFHNKTAEVINGIGFCYWLKGDFDVL